MATTNLLKAIPLSFYSKALYQEVRRFWRGRSFIYLLIVLAICWLLITIAGSIYFSQSKLLTSQIDYIVNQMPVITFKGGIASTSPPEQFDIKIKPDSEQLFLIIDTQNKYATSEKFRTSSAKILISKEMIEIKRNNKDIKSYPFSKELSGQFGPKELKQVLHKIRNTLTVIGILFYPVGLFIIYLFYLLQSLIYAVIGLLFASMAQQKIPYATLLSLSMVAVTPLIIICTMIAISSPAILPHAIAFGSILPALYLFFMIQKTEG